MRPSLFDTPRRRDLLRLGLRITGRRVDGERPASIERLARIRRGERTVLRAAELFRVISLSGGTHRRGAIVEAHALRKHRRQLWFAPRQANVLHTLVALFD